MPALKTSRMVGKRNGETSPPSSNPLSTPLLKLCPVKSAKRHSANAPLLLASELIKVRVLRGQGLDPDPAAELCRLLGINRQQLPERLELPPGEEIPEGFGPVIDVLPVTGETDEQSGERESSASLTNDQSQGADADGTAE